MSKSITCSSVPSTATERPAEEVAVTEVPTLNGWFHRNERGQATAEYALVLLGAAAVALLVVAWATKTDLIGNLLDSVISSIAGKAGTP